MNLSHAVSPRPFSFYQLILRKITNSTHKNNSQYIFAHTHIPIHHKNTFKIYKLQHRTHETYDLFTRRDTHCHYKLNDDSLQTKLKKATRKQN